ncbi:hypothetical protein RSAG8_08715, partial [Rhizoctonia solani AG-8 WAC10335]
MPDGYRIHLSDGFMSASEVPAVSPAGLGITIVYVMRVYAHEDPELSRMYA